MLSRTVKTDTLPYGTTTENHDNVPQIENTTLLKVMLICCSTNQKAETQH